jgi:glycosyltransferase involved in cell wall biosynthesis
VETLATMREVDWHAAIVGSGPLEQEIRDAIRRAGLHERVRLTGAVPDAARYFAAFDVLALTSRTEGLPIVLLEAVAASVPVVATRVGGIPDALDGRGGLLVPSESPSETAAALERALREPGAARIAPTLSSSNDTAGWLEAYEDIYRQLAAIR